MIVCCSRITLFIKFPPGHKKTLVFIVMLPTICTMDGGGVYDEHNIQIYITTDRNHVKQ